MGKKKFSAYRGGKSPSPVSNVLDSAFKALRISGKVRQYAAFPHWPEIVGEEIARVTIPEKISRGNVLLVRVSDAAWAQELSLQKPEILDKIFQAGLGASVDDIRFVTGNPKDFEKN